MKFIFKIVSLLWVLMCGVAFAQPVVYRLSVPSFSMQNLESRTPLQLFQKDLGQMVINYRPGGYDAVMDGERLSFSTTAGVATITRGKLVLTISMRDSFWHNRVGMWRESPVTSSYGDRGIHRMFYAGMVPYGRLYREELWLNGRLFVRSETVIDHMDRIVWSVANDAQGELRLERM